MKTRLIRVFASANGTYYACMRRSRSRALILDREFADTHDSLEVGLVDAAGGFAAIEDQFISYDSLARTVTVWDIARRKEVWHIPTGVADQSRCPTTYGAGELSDLELKSSGAVAWITEDDPCALAPGQEVHRADRRGTTLVMTDPAVHQGSLRLRGSTLSWLVGEDRRTTDLR